jgi:streptomycin 6-kinase
VALAQLKDTSLDHDDHLVCLEALARLAWSDDSVRQVGVLAWWQGGGAVLAA